MGFIFTKSFLVKQWFLIILSTILFIASDSLAAGWGKGGGKFMLVALFVLAPLGYIFFGYLNQIKTLSVSSGLVNMGLLLGTVLVGVLIFNDHLTSRQIAGLIFAFMAIVLMA